jgi:ABC-type molybdate transport system ATPase subunit
MNYDDIFGELHALPVLLVMHEENVTRMLSKFVLAALQGIVEGLGHLEEVVASGDDFPVGIHLYLIQ